jgi:hypothetical protein
MSGDGCIGHPSSASSSRFHPISEVRKLTGPKRRKAFHPERVLSGFLPVRKLIVAGRRNGPRSIPASRVYDTVAPRAEDDTVILATQNSIVGIAWVSSLLRYYMVSMFFLRRDVLAADGTPQVLANHRLGNRV